MSASLYWRPHVPDPEGEEFGYQLKWLLVKRLGLEGDGSLNTEWAVVGDDLRPWLEGVRDAQGAAAKEADVLLGLLDQHGQVEVRIWNG